jgi:hypothetical protein
VPGCGIDQGRRKEAGDGSGRLDNLSSVVNRWLTTARD